MSIYGHLLEFVANTNYIDSECVVKESILNKNKKPITHMSQIRNNKELISYFKRIYKTHNVSDSELEQIKNMIQNPQQWNPNKVWIYELGLAGVTEECIKNIAKNHKQKIEGYIDTEYYSSESQLKYKKKSIEIIDSIRNKSTLIVSDGGGSEFFITDDNKIYYYDRDCELYNTPISIKGFIEICKGVIKNK